MQSSTARCTRTCCKASNGLNCRRSAEKAEQIHKQAAPHELGSTPGLCDPPGFLWFLALAMFAVPAMPLCANAGTSQGIASNRRCGKVLREGPGAGRVSALGAHTAGPAGTSSGQALQAAQQGECTCGRTVNTLSAVLRMPAVRRGRHTCFSSWSAASSATSSGSTSSARSDCCSAGGVGTALALTGGRGAPRAATMVAEVAGVAAGRPEVGLAVDAAPAGVAGAAAGVSSTLPSTLPSRDSTSATSLSASQIDLAEGGCMTSMRVDPQNYRL